MPLPLIPILWGVGALSAAYLAKEVYDGLESRDKAEKIKNSKKIKDYLEKGNYNEVFVVFSEDELKEEVKKQSPDTIELRIAEKLEEKRYNVCNALGLNRNKEVSSQFNNLKLSKKIKVEVGDVLIL